MVLNFALVYVGNDFFLVRANNQDDYNFLLYEGSWIVARHYLTFGRWKPLFHLIKKIISTTTV